MCPEESTDSVSACVFLGNDTRPAPCPRSDRVVYLQTGIKEAGPLKFSHSANVRPTGLRAFLTPWQLFPDDGQGNTNARPQSFSYGRLQRRVLPSIFPGRYAHLSPKDTTERTFRFVSNGWRYLRERRTVRTNHGTCFVHPPLSEVFEWRLAQNGLKFYGKGRPGHACLAS